MIPSDLKYEVEKTGSVFFTRESMRFFGDTMRNYGVRQADNTWELYRKKPVKHGLQKSAFFDMKTFERIHPEITY